ncbi:MAG: hypothetical protein HeimC3_09950 [Candidatus Heimdallarchaeota archaeon LC_3]|nr:MAG: hypothetical protein HeimC3_09950 [Candidatus Heimdallarchaeota archaeon LC_3]
MNLKDFISYDKDLPFNGIEINESKDYPHAQIKDIEIDNTLGGKIKFYLVIPKTSGPHPIIEFIHWLETEADNSNRSEFLPSAIELAKDGYLSILPDAFWSTTPEKFKKNPVPWWKTEYEFDKNLCIKQIIELLRIHDYVLTLKNVDIKRIGLVGHDFGAMFGSLLLNFVSNFKAFVLMAATTKFYHWFKFGSKLSDTELNEYGNRMELFNPINYIEILSPSPILFQFADDDFYIPKEIAKDFFQRASDPKELK